MTIIIERNLKFLVIFLIILGLNLAFLLTNFYKYQGCLLYLDLYEVLSDDINSIDLPYIIFENYTYYFLVIFFIFYIFLAIFLSNFDLRLISLILRVKIFLNKLLYCDDLKERSPPRK